jgi:hypothetical protein
MWAAAGAQRFITNVPGGALGRPHQVFEGRTVSSADVTDHHGPMEGRSRWMAYSPAVLKANMKIKNKLPPGTGP